MHGINQISSIQIFAMVIILHNPTSGDKSRFNRQPKRLETTKKSTLKFLSLQELSNISLN